MLLSSSTPSGYPGNDIQISHSDCYVVSWSMELSGYACEEKNIMHKVRMVQGAMTLVT